MTPNVRIENLEKYFDRFFSSWTKSFSLEDYTLCRDKIAIFIADLKPIYQHKLYGDSEKIVSNYSNIYLFLMLAKSFEDILHLVDLTKDKTWPQDQKKTELIWQILWDAKERMDIFCSHCSHPDQLERFYNLLKKLELCFYDLFGKGLYFSSVIIVKRAICNICNKNIKGCEHIPGNFYGGIRCKEIVQDMEFKGIDLVQSPHDMRCKVWPWNVSEDGRITGRAMNLNQLDAWIDE
jgi:hypothetical protein